MQATPPFQVVSGQRQLAAVMFTDAVGFSARMNEQELATLNRMERDMELMRRIAGGHSGIVLKTTGDGLLVRFASAVDAVGCALEIQRGFAERLRPNEPETGLRHRIGIHLGDVYINGDDIMGDGVNIAARLVNEAPPGGIIVSQVVHEVVKNKLGLRAVSLGARHLKNIREPVVLVRIEPEVPISPVTVVSAVPVSAATAPALPASAPPAEEPAPRRRGVVALGTVAVVAAAAWFLIRAQERHERELGESQATQAALADLLKQKAATGDTAAAQPTAFDFAAATTHTPARQQQPAPAPEMLAAASEAAARLETWRLATLPDFPRDRPLVVRGLGDPGFTGATVFSDPAGRLHVAEGGASRRRDWADWNDAGRAAVLVALIKARTDVPADTRRAVEAYAFLEGRPEIIRALRE